MSKGTTVCKLGAVVAIGIAAAFPAASVSETQAEAGEGPSIEGTFSIAGQGDDGSKYTGTGVVAKVGGAMYTAKWSIGSNVFTGVCFRDDDDFSCGWAAKAKDANVVAYLVKGDGLDGVWFEEGDSVLGTEYLKPTKGKMAKNLDGAYKITNAKFPNGTAYSGTAKVKQLIDVGEAVYSFDWVINGGPSHGVGVRNMDSGQDDVLSVGFADTGKEFGTLQYNVQKGGKVLDGNWVQSINGTVSDGREKMTKL